MTILIDDVSTDTTSDEFFSNGGPAIINLRANDLGGATVEIQTRTVEDGLNRYQTLPAGNFTTATSVKLDYLPQGTVIRVVVSGTTGSSDGIFVDILQ